MLKVFCKVFLLNSKFLVCFELFFTILIYFESRNFLLFLYLIGVWRHLFVYLYFALRVDVYKFLSPHFISSPFKVETVLLDFCVLWILWIKCWWGVEETWSAWMSCGLLGHVGHVGLLKLDCLGQEAISLFLFWMWCSCCVNYS